MLFHHSAEDYGAAATKAAGWATEKLNKVIQNGQANAINIMNYIDTHKPQDTIVPNSRLRIKPNATSLKLSYINQGGFERSFSLHPHALIQVADRAGMPTPRKILNWLNGPEDLRDLSTILNRKYSNQENKRYLLRSIDGQIRGFLSDRYRRLDSSKVIDVITAEAIEKFGAIPIEAKALDTSFHLKVILPHIFEPAPNEVGVFGLCFRNSDFGAGRLYLKGFFNRLWCTNLAMTEDGISQIHLGKRLTEDIEFSEETYRLDTEAMASAVKDVVHHILSPENVKRRLALVEQAAQETCDAESIIKVMQGKKLDKGEANTVRELYTSADIKLLPAGQTKWRLSNAISLLAQRSVPERQLELENLAGEVAGLHLKA